MASCSDKIELGSSRHTNNTFTVGETPKQQPGSKENVKRLKKKKNTQVGKGKVEKERMDEKADKCMGLRNARHTVRP